VVKSDVGFPHKFLWKIKVPAKIKMFFWLIARKSIPTKDNLIRKRWKGRKECVYCGQNESIDHLFFQCSAARLIWSLVKCAFDLRSIPNDLDDCLNVWLKTFQKSDKRLTLVGVSAMFWSIWKCRNDIIF
jgi:hypothetical protein